MTTRLITTTVLIALSGFAADEAKTFTGCLKAGAQPNDFVLVLSRDKTEIPVTGADLAKHVGHTVELKGTMKDMPGEKKLEATEVKHVAAECTP